MGGDKPIHTLAINGMTSTLPPPSAGGLAAGAPLAGLATLGLSAHGQKEWDQLSMYSQRTDRSMPRSRALQYSGE